MPVEVGDGTPELALPSGILEDGGSSEGVTGGEPGMLLLSGSRSGVCAARSSRIEARGFGKPGIEVPPIPDPEREAVGRYGVRYGDGFPGRAR